MMLTRCPYCGATFRVAHEQLKMRQGQVRCGQCRRIFDGLHGLVGNEPASPSAAPTPVDRPQPVPAAPSRPSAQPKPTPAVPPAPIVHPEPAPVAPPPVAQPEPARIMPPLPPMPPLPFASEMPPQSSPRARPAYPELPSLDTWLAEEPLEPPQPKPTSVPVSRPLPDLLPEVDEYIEMGTDPLNPLTEPERKKIQRKLKSRTRSRPTHYDLDPPTILDLHVPAFAKAARMGETGARWPWWIGSLFLFLLGVGQLLLYFRTEVSFSVPEARPTLVAVCETLGCQVSLPHKINLLSIEASDLTPDGKLPGVLHLSAQLHNRAQYAQAWPDLEITLTDVQEHPLLRRTLTPAEFLPAGIDPDKGFPAFGDQPVQLTLTTDIPAVGYRLYIFHH